MLLKRCKIRLCFSCFLGWPILYTPCKGPPAPASSEKQGVPALCIPAGPGLPPPREQMTRAWNPVHSSASAARLTPPPGLLHLNPPAGSSHQRSNLATASYLPGSLLLGQPGPDPSPSSRQLPFPACGPTSDGIALPSQGSFRNTRRSDSIQTGVLYTN